MTTALTIKCPLCGAPVQQCSATTFDDYIPGYAVNGRVEQRARETEVAACTGCEFLVDLRQTNGTPKTSRQLLLEVGKWVGR